MYKQQQKQSKYSLHLTKVQTPELAPMKFAAKGSSPIKQKDSFSKDYQTNQLKDKEPKADLNTKIDNLSNEITNLKEKLTDINLSNAHLKSKLREKTPSKSMSQRPQNSFNDQQQPKHLHLQQYNEKSMRQAFLMSACLNNDQQYQTVFAQPQRQLYSQREEIKEKERKIEQLKEKSKKLESLVITLENKLDTSNKLLPHMISKVNECQRVYDETKKENEQMKHQNYAKDRGSLEYCINQPLHYQSLQVKSNDNDHHDENKRQIDALSHCNKTLKEEQMQLRKTIEEMKTNLSHCLAFKVTNDKLIAELAKIREENAALKRDLASKCNTIGEMTQEGKDLKTNSKKIEMAYYNQISALTQEKEQLINANSKLMSDNSFLERKNKAQSEKLNKKPKINEDTQEIIESLNKAIQIKEEALVNSHQLINQLEMEKATFIKETKVKGDKADLDCQQYKKQIEEYQTENIAKNNAITQFKSDIETLKKTIMKYKEEISQMKETYEKEESLQVNSLKEQVKQFDIQCIEKEAELNRLICINEDRDKEIEQFKKTFRENEELKEKEQQLNKNNIEEINQIKENLLLDLNELKADNEGKNKEMEHLTAIILQMKEQLKEKEDKINTLYKVNDEAIIMMKDKDKELEEQTTAFVEKVSIINKLEIELDRQNKELTEVINSKNKEIDCLTEHNNAMTNQLLHLNCLTKDKEKEADKDNMTINELLNYYNITEDILTQERNSNELASYPSTIRAIDKLKIENHLLQSKNMSLTQIANTIDTLKLHQSAIEQELKARNNEIALLNENQSKSDKVIAEQQESLSQLLQTKQTLQSDYDANKDKLDCELEKSKSQLQINQNLLNQLDQLKESYETLKNDKQKLEEALTKDKADNESRLSSILSSNDHDKEEHRKTMEEFAKKIKSLMTMNDNKAKDITEYKKTIEKKESEIKSLQNQNLDLTNDVLLSQSKMTEALNKLKKLQAINQQNEQDANIKLKQANDLFNEKEKLILVLQEKLNGCSKDKEELLQKRGQLEQIIKDLTTATQIKEEEMKIKEEEMRTINQNANEKLSQMDKRMKEMQLECDNKEELLKEFKDKSDSTLAKLKEKDEAFDKIKLELDNKLLEISELAMNQQSKELNLSNSLTLLQKNNGELVQAMAEKDNAISRLETRINELNKTVKTDKQIAIQKDIELNTLKDQMKEKEDALTDSNRQHREESTLIKQQNQKAIELTRELDQLNIIINTKNSDIYDLKMKSESFQNELIILQNKLKESKECLSNMKRDMARKNEELEELNKLKEEYEAIKELNEKLVHSNKEYADKSTYKDNVIAELQSEKNKLQELNPALSAQIASLNLKNNELVLQMTSQAKLEEEMSILKKELIQSNSARNALTSTYELDTQSLKEELSLKEQELTQIRKNMNEVNTKYEGEAAKGFALNEQIAKLQSDLETRQSKSLQRESDIAALNAQSKLKEDSLNEELQKLKAQDMIQRDENDKLIAQLLILTTNSTKSSYQIEKTAETLQSLQNKKEETNQLNDHLLNLQIELKGLQEEHSKVSSELEELKEVLIQKDITLKDNEDSTNKLIEENAQMKEEHKALTRQLSELSSLTSEVEKLKALLSEKDIELANYQKINDKLIVVNQELSEKVNLESIEMQKDIKPHKEGQEDQDSEILDKDEYMSLVMKNDSLNELIRSKEEEITTLKKELENYHNEVNKAMAYDNESLNNKAKDSSSVSSLNQTDDINKLQETLVKVKKGYKEKSNEVNMLQQQLSLLKGDIKNYQSKVERMKEECPQIDDYTNFKAKIMAVLHDYKPKKKELIEIANELKTGMGEDYERSQGFEKKKGLFGFLKNIK